MIVLWQVSGRECGVHVVDRSAGDFQVHRGAPAGVRFHRADTHETEEVVLDQHSASTEATSCSRSSLHCSAELSPERHRPRGENRGNILRYFS